MDNQTFSFTQNGTNLLLSGFLNGEGMQKIENSVEPGNVYVLDFDNVTGINFAALRGLLRCREAGKRFLIINVSDAVAEKFEDTGVSSLISICRKAKPLDMSQYVEFGASFLSKAYNSKDGDAMIKVYGTRVPKVITAQEKAVAKAVLLFGLPTPLVGTLYEDDGHSALEFERIEGKRSFSRIVYDEPERLEEMSVRFARMCKKLHSTPCDTNMFNNRKTFYRNAVNSCKELSESERAVANAFLDNIPDATTCLHGDMQLSNIINNGVEDMWIDLGEFGYGYYMLDIPKGQYPFLTAVKDYGANYLEYWCQNISLQADMSLNVSFDKLEIYGLHVFSVKGAGNSLMVYFRPMSLPKFQQGMQDIAPDDIVIKATIDNQEMRVINTNMVKEFAGGRELTAYLIQVETNESNIPWHKFDLKITDADNHYGAATIYKNEVNS